MAINYLFMFVDDVVDYPIFFGLLGVHNEIPLNVLFHLLKLLPGVLGQHLIGDFSHAQDLSCMYINICGLATKA